MKNISYLLLVSILFFSNCSNDNDVEEMLTETITNITEADLVGDWDFVSLEFEGKTYTECDDELRKKYVLLNLSLLDVTLESQVWGVPSFIFYTNCNKNGTSINQEMKFYVNGGNTFIFEDTEFLIVFYDNKKLKLKLLSNFSYHPNGGVYTLLKRN